MMKCFTVKLLLIVMKSNLQSWEMQPHVTMEPPPKRKVGIMFLGVLIMTVFFSPYALTRQSVTFNTNRLFSNRCTPYSEIPPCFYHVPCQSVPAMVLV